VIWFGCTSNCCASSASVRSPLTAASATFALNAAECVRRVLFVMSSVPLPALSLAKPRAFHLSRCPNSRGHLSDLHEQHTLTALKSVIRPRRQATKRRANRKKDECDGVASGPLLAALQPRIFGAEGEPDLIRLAASPERQRQAARRSNRGVACDSGPGGNLARGPRFAGRKPGAIADWRPAKGGGGAGPPRSEADGQISFRWRFSAKGERPGLPRSGDAGKWFARPRSGCPEGQSEGPGGPTRALARCSCPTFGRMA
jgi:hypothetical protein